MTWLKRTIDREQQTAPARAAAAGNAGGRRGVFSNGDVSKQPALIALLPQVAEVVGLPVIVAHDLPMHDRFMQELESFEMKTTAAGNTVLDARG